MNLFRLKPKRKDRNTEVASIESDIPVEDKKRNNRTARDSISEDGTKNSVGATNLHEHDDDNNNDTASGAERTENYEHDNDEESTHRVESISIEANITPGATEKNTLLSVLFELRKDGTFCDVAFLCHGTLFTAHRCVVRIIELKFTKPLLLLLYQQIGKFVESLAPCFVVGYEKRAKPFPRFGRSCIDGSLRCTIVWRGARLHVWQTAYSNR